MSLNHSPSIVTDGLVLCLDTANKRSYPGTGTAWTDIAGGNNGILENGPTFDSSNAGNIVFDGSDDRVDLPSSIVTSFPLSICAWTRSTGSSSMRVVAISDDNTSNTRLALSFFGGGLYYIVKGGTGTAVNSMGKASVNDNTWHYIVGTSSSSSDHKFYFDGSLEASSTTNITNVNGLSHGRVGCERTSSTERQFLDGDVSIVKIYNLALTSEEVRQNFEATVGRYQ